jgi:hypothetical protein
VCLRITASGGLHIQTRPEAYLPHTFEEGIAVRANEGSIEIRVGAAAISTLLSYPSLGEFCSSDLRKKVSLYPVFIRSVGSQAYATDKTPLFFNLLLNH